VVIQLLLIISNVLYPAMARMPDKRPFVRRVDRIAIPAWFVGAAILLGVLAIVLQLFGASFPFDWRLALVFSGWAALAAINGTYAVIVNAHSERSCAREVAFQPVRIVFLAIWFVVLGTSGELTLLLSVTGMACSEVLEAGNLRLVLRQHVVPRQPGT
jgi:hypothetical protein